MMLCCSQPARRGVREALRLSSPCLLSKTGLRLLQPAPPQPQSLAFPLTLRQRSSVGKHARVYAGASESDWTGPFASSETKRSFSSAVSLARRGEGSSGTISSVPPATPSLRRRLKGVKKLDSRVRAHVLAFGLGRPRDQHAQRLLKRGLFSSFPSVAFFPLGLLVCLRCSLRLSRDDGGRGDCSDAQERESTCRRTVLCF